MVKINEETKVFHILEEFPESEPVVKKYFSYFYEHRLVDIALKRLTIKGAFTVLNTPEEEQKEFFKELKEAISNKASVNIP
ncbi:MAG: hypothetical protein D6831_01440 [Aquificota bacterium]|nr:MAG: hypothetical protein D6831_01440 [Aquificota bacterium]